MTADMFRIRKTLAAVLIAAAAASGCQSVLGVDSHHVLSADNIDAAVGPGVFFLTLNFQPAAWMEALFDGVVSADEAGCLRLDTEDRHTVVWPHGYGFEIDGDEVHILDAQGELVGTLGGNFRFGGGEVTSLHDGLGFSQSDRDLAETRCPGRFWIASPSDG